MANLKLSSNLQKMLIILIKNKMIEENHEGYIVKECSRLGFCKLTDISSGTFENYKKAGYLSYERVSRTIIININLLKSKLGNDVIEKIIKGEVTENNTKALKPKISSQNAKSENTIDAVIKNITDTLEILRFVKNKELDAIFIKLPMIGVIFTNIYLSTKKRLEEEGTAIINQANNAFEAKISFANDEEYLMKNLIILAKAVQNDTKIQKILENNEQIFTIATETLFGINSSLAQ